MFTADELARMRAAQDGHMMDTCIRQVYSGPLDSFREEVAQYADGAELICGLDMSTGTEYHNPDNTLLEYDATLRLPIATVLDPRDRIKITKRFGETLSPPLVYEMAGPIQRGPSGIRIRLKKVVT